MYGCVYTLIQAQHHPRTSTRAWARLSDPDRDIGSDLIRRTQNCTRAKHAHHRVDYRCEVTSDRVTLSQSMQRCMFAVAIAAACNLLLPAMCVAREEGAEPCRPQVEANIFPHESSDTAFPKLNTAAPRDLPRAGEQPARTDEVELLAAIVSARITEPERVIRVLNELRLESTGHLSRLNREEWSEMMAEMQSGGVALGSRNKLRLLVAAKSTTVRASSVGSRRVQADESSSRTGRQDDSASTATKQAREQESTKKSESTIFGVSGDSACDVPLR